MQKVRCLNDLHHAQDAYLNIVVGNAYRTKFTKNPINFIREADKHDNKGKYRYHMSKMFEYDIIRGSDVAWKASDDNGPGSIAIVKRVMAKNTPIITKRSYNYAKGRGITNKDTVYGKNAIKNPDAYMGVSTSDPRLMNVEKYGGRTDIASMCYTLVEYKVKGKTVRSMEALPVFLGDIDLLDNVTIWNYLNKSIQAENKNKPVTDLKILIRDIRYNSLMKIDGYYYYLGGRTGNQIILRSAVQFKMNMDNALYLKKIEKAVGTGYFEEKDSNKDIIITKKRNIEFYEFIQNKLYTTILKNRKNNIITIMQSGKDKYIEMDIPSQCEILLGIVNWVNGSSPTVNMKAIGGSNNSGVCKITKKINGLEEVVLTNMSVAGMYEHRIDLLNI